MVLLQVFRLLGVLIVAWCWTGGAAAAELTGSYMEDGRPNRLVLLSLVQVGQGGHGQITRASVAEDRQLQQQTIAVTLSVSGAAFTLQAADGSSFTATGRKEGNALHLSMAWRSGALQQATLRAGEPKGFVALVQDWSHSLALGRAAAHAASDLRNALSKEHSGMKATGIPRDLLAARTWLEASQTSFKQLGEERAQLEQLMARLPMNCQAFAQGPADHFSRTMGYNYSNLLGYNLGQLRNAVKSLESRLARVDQTATNVSQLDKQLTNALRAAGSDGGQWGAADTSAEVNSDLKAYRLIATAAQADLPSIQIEAGQIAHQAKALMRDAQASLKVLQASLGCR